MTRIRALAVVCLLFVLIGGSVQFAVGDNSRNAAETSEQIAVPSVAESGEVEVVPEEHRILRDQSAFFVVRVDGIPEDENTFLLGLRTESVGEEVSYEFHDEAVSTFELPPFFPEVDVAVYVPKPDSGEVAHVPVSLSSNTKFDVDEYTVETVAWTKDFDKIGKDESEIGIRCAVKCRIELFVEWTVQNLERIVAVLGLLIAFFGRKKIWAVLRVPRRHIANTVGSRRKRDVDTGGGEREREK